MKFIAEEKLIQEILLLEKTYNKNSFNFLEDFFNGKENDKNFKTKIESFIFYNGSIDKINKIDEITFCYLESKGSSEMEYFFKIKNFINEKPKNTIVILKRNDFYYKSVIEKLNANGIFVILVTEEKEDFELKNYFPFLFIYNQNRLKEINYITK